VLTQIFFCGISHSIQLASHELSAELRSSASAEALAVAIRLEEALREKTRPRRIERFFSLKGLG